MKYPEYYGYLETNGGGTFCLEGDYFTRTLPSGATLHCQSEEIHDQLRGLVITDIGGKQIGDDAHVLIELPSGRSHILDDIVEANRHFKLGAFQ